MYSGLSRCTSRDVRFEPCAGILGTPALEGKKPALGDQEGRGTFPPVCEGVAQPRTDRGERAPVPVVRHAVHHVDPALQGAADERGDASKDAASSAHTGPRRLMARGEERLEAIGILVQVPGLGRQVTVSHLFSV